jgi:hypothetical protein
MAYQNSSIGNEKVSFKYKHGLILFVKKSHQNPTKDINSSWDYVDIINDTPVHDAMLTLECCQEDIGTLVEIFPPPLPQEPRPEPVDCNIFSV